MAFEALRIRPGRRLDLADVDAGATPGCGAGKRRAESETAKNLLRMERLQERFYADGRRGLLVVLQGMDTSGKDGTVRHVFAGVNPQGVRVHAFKVPTPEELAHDFLWRVHPHVPGKGEIAIFNRSHYEDVLIVRVHHLVPEKVWRARYRAINGFERELAREGTVVVKFCLYIDRDEQARRLEDRRSDPSKQWKLSESDAAERTHWDEYQAAYAEMLRKTSTSTAPWHLVPSNHKWYRNWAVSRVLVDTLEALAPKFPPPSVDLAHYRID